MEFAEDFFKKEVREGFEVSEMMKRAWAAELEVLMTVFVMPMDYNGLLMVEHC